MILKADGHRAGVRALIDLEGIANAVSVEDLMQLARVDLQTILVAHIDRNRPVLAQVADVLIDER